MSIPDHELFKVETPCYVFDPEKVISNYVDLRAEIGTALIVSFKANPLVDLYVRCSHAFVDGIELASIGELNAVVGRSQIPKFVNTPAMDRTLMSAAIACRARVVLDNSVQASIAVELAPGLVRNGGVWLRLNAGSILGSDSGPERDHFGMDVPTALRAVETLAAAGIPVTGLHVHAGSGTFVRLGVALAERMGSVVDEFNSALTLPLKSLNLGGGIPGDWRETGLSFAQYRQALEPLASSLELFHEAGRAIHSSAGTFVVRVLSCKQIGERSLAVCDGGIAQAFLLAQTESFVKKVTSPRLLRQNGISNPSIGNSSSPITLVGNSCNRADVIGHLESENAPAEGDVVRFDNSGAYSTYTPATFLNSKIAKKYVL